MKKIRKKKSGNKAVRKKKPKRHLNPVALALFAGILLCGWLIYFVPRSLTDSKLKELGYDKEAIAEIRKQKLTKSILNGSYYSDYLQTCIKNGTLNTDYLDLYTAVSADRSLDDEDFLLCNRLRDLGYEEDQLQNLFSQLVYKEITPLLTLDWQWDENDYIADCIENRGKSTAETFVLSSSYREKYKYTYAAEDEADDQVLVNYNYYLPEDYEPDDLTVLSSEIAVTGMSLREEAADAADELIRASLNAGVPFFVSASYISWDDQDYSYQLQANRSSQSEADELVIRAGFSEHQTGLAINVVPTYETGDFETTETYQWLQQNAASYGWIQRYPSGKAKITGMEDNENQYRYLGRDLAEKVSESGLSYDEYYGLYLKTWDNASCIPSGEILNTTGCTKETAEQAAAAKNSAETESEETASPDSTSSAE